jgi:hypothetical protein
MGQPLNYLFQNDLAKVSGREYAGFTTGHFSNLFVSTPHTAGVVEGNLKIFLDSVGVAGLV